MSQTPRIGTGYVNVDAPCPECGALVEILAVVRSVLTSPEDDVPTLRLKLKAKAVDHECRKHQLTITDAARYAPFLKASDASDELPGQMGIEE